MTVRENADWFNETPESLVMLAEERAKLAASEMRYAVAEALREIIDEWAAGMLDCEDLADAAIAAHLDALKADGYALVKLPEPIGDDGVNRAWQWVSRWWDLPPNEPRVVSMHSAPRLLSVDDARCLAAQLLAAADAAEAQR